MQLLPTIVRNMANPARNFTVYVIELSSDAIPPSQRGQNVKGCLYIGQTAHTPEHRFSQHKSGGKLSARRVARYGLRLRPDLCANLPQYASREAAERAERELAGSLQKDGFVVFYG